jgi:tRNA(Ile2)-agmatinylcytidine synthase
VIPIYIGIDDTDSVSGMCTTYLATELILEFSECDVIGYPRLVRLNPNIPWKTRGNGAIALRFGKGSGRRFPIGEIQGRTIYGFERGREVDIRDVKVRVKNIVEGNARFEDKNTNPAFVITHNKPSQSLYWHAIREVVGLEDVKKLLKSYGAIFRGYKNKRGLIGASAAISWRPRDRTYEITAYREKRKWGTKRRVGRDSVIKMDKAFSSTFNNYDYNNRNLVIAPNSPCPVLFGIRGTKPKYLPMAMEMIRSETKDRWLIFMTNQGTDEHLQKKRILDITRYASVITRGTVVSQPKTIEGGHVIFTIEDRRKIDCAAYEPTKEFRALVRNLRVGDDITVYGGVRKSPLTINIEKLKVNKLVEIYEKSGNPICPKCHKKMKSMGRNAGYRCPKCRTKAGEAQVKKKKVKRDIEVGFYEVPVCARRHLAKPLKRIKT